ncbi:MAG: NUDIX domain-containing protein [Candidatus Micrarchaeales archaeon]|nr:NUDIX domain-containing protein [Candidatus Micrarchaeales archaeon]
MKDGKKVELTATGIVVNGGKLLLVHHKKLKLWLPPGGHVEENELPNDCVVREIKEETGLDVEIIGKPRQEAGGRVFRMPVPYMMQLEDILGTHWHFDLIYRCEMNGGSLRKSDESNDVGFFSLDEIIAMSDTTDDVKHIAMRLLKK